MKMIVSYDLRGAHDQLGSRCVHPQRDMMNLAVIQGFSIVHSLPIPIADCWWFWLEFDRRPDLPAYTREVDYVEFESMA